MPKRTAAPKETPQQQQYQYQNAFYVRFFDDEGIAVGDSGSDDAFGFEEFDPRAELWHKVEPLSVAARLKTDIERFCSEPRVYTLTLSPAAARALIHEKVIIPALLLSGVSETEDEITFNGRLIIVNKIFVIKVARKPEREYVIE